MPKKKDSNLLKNIKRIFKRRKYKRLQEVDSDDEDLRRLFPKKDETYKSYSQPDLQSGRGISKRRRKRKIIKRRYNLRSIKRRTRQRNIYLD